MRDKLKKTDRLDDASILYGIEGELDIDGLKFWYYDEKASNSYPEKDDVPNFAEDSKTALRLLECTTKDAVSFEIVYRCNEYEEVFLSEELLDKHMPIHKDAVVVVVTVHECKECSKIFSSEEHLRTHLSTHTATNIQQPPSTTNIPSQKRKQQSEFETSTASLHEENLTLENKRLKLEVERLEIENEKSKLAMELIKLKKQCLTLQIENFGKSTS